MLAAAADCTASFQSTDVKVAEGSEAQLTVVLTEPGCNSEDLEGTVKWETKDGTATVADKDYQASSGTLRFLLNENSKTISIPTNEDPKVEKDETFTVVLSEPDGTTITSVGPPATVTILNDDQPPSPSPSPPPSPPPSPSPRPSPAPSPTESPTPEPELSALPSPSPTVEAAPRRGGLPGPVIVAIVSGSVALLSGLGLLWLKRTTPI
jgi:hypothetical protein